MIPVFLRISTPDEQGYQDIARVYDGMTLVYECNASTNPNPYQPQSKVKWSEVYAQICCGKYSFEGYENPKHGFSLLVNSGSRVPTTNPNKNHSMSNYATEILVHKGYSDTWRGSKACITIKPEKSKEYFSHFDMNSSGAIIVTDDISFKPVRSDFV